MKRTITAYFEIKKINEDKQIVKAEVYAPYILDAHGDLMVPEDIELLVERFKDLDWNNVVDTQHNNIPNGSVVLDSYVQKQDDEIFSKGAWVAEVKVSDIVWPSVKMGLINGFSMEILAKSEPRVAEVEIVPYYWGETEVNEGHTHLFFLEFDEDGRVMKGRTSTDNGHSHSISVGTATDLEKNHAHRFILGEFT